MNGPVAKATGADIELPITYSLDQNYPNPFNPTTVISYSLPADERTTLKVYDILGREVAVLVDDVVSGGVHQTRFDASSLASGVYFYRMHAGGFVETKKLLLLR